MADPVTAVPDFWQYFSTMGVGGALAGFAMWMLNKAWKDHAETLKDFHEAEKGRTDMLVGVVKENTNNTAQNNTLLSALHRRLDREEYERSTK